MKSFLTKLQNRVFAPVDIASLVFFRITFGLLMTWEVCRYFRNGWIYLHWLEPRILFKYYGFSWVHPWPGHWLYVHWGAIGVLGLLVAAGFLYRISATLMFLSYAYFFLLDETRYVNHTYLICLFCFLLIFIPANRAFSVDAVKKYKPAAETYQYVARELGVSTADLRMIAAHAWDIHGALRAGSAAAFIARPGHALFPLGAKPDVVAPDLGAAVDRIVAAEPQ